MWTKKPKHNVFDSWISAGRPVFGTLGPGKLVRSHCVTNGPPNQRKMQKAVPVERGESLNASWNVLVGFTSVQPCVRVFVP